jgi:hypothetical protein
MTDPAVERAERTLARRRHRMRAGLALAPAAAALALAVLPLSSRLSIAFAAGALVQLLACAVQSARIDGLVARLALEPAAYAIPEVREYGARLARERASLGAWLVEVLDDAGRPDSLYLSDRVAHYAEEIHAAAQELMAPGSSVPPVCLATCRRLLTVATDSPLYNANVPAVDLGSALFRIRAGIRTETARGAYGISHS